MADLRRLSVIGPSLQHQKINKEEFFRSADLPDPAAAHQRAPFARQFHSDRRLRWCEGMETQGLLRRYLHLALDPQLGQDAAVQNFAAKSFRYGDDNDGIVFIRRALPLVVCGVPFMAQTDVCVMDGENEGFPPAAGRQLVAEFELEGPSSLVVAIAAYAVNNNKIRTHLAESSTTSRPRPSRDHDGRHGPHLLQNHRHC